MADKQNLSSTPLFHPHPPIHFHVLTPLRKRRGYRDHLVQALVDAASGPVPPSALLPIIRAKETGPAAIDLALEVLERITSEVDNGSGGDSGGGGKGSKQAVIGERDGRCC